MPRSAVAPALVRKRQAAEPEPEGYSTGVYGNATPSGAQLLGDEEYAPRFHDRVTHNWRRSLSENARIEEERRALWAERLAALKARGLLQ
jgi:hypothetical protein